MLFRSDSLSGVEFRNQVKKDTGMQIPATVIFDYPTPEKVAEYLRELLFPEDRLDPDPQDSDEDMLANQEDGEIDAMDVGDLIQTAFHD